MNESQNIHKKKNSLIIVLMVLAVAFVCLMCYIIIYAKKNPPLKFKSQDEIEVKLINTAQYNNLDKVNYTIIEQTTNFTVYEKDKELQLILKENGEVKVQRDDKEETVELMQGDNNVNNNIKLIYQKNDEGIILTNDGQLYKLLDSGIVNGQIQVGESLNGLNVTNVVTLGSRTEGVFVITDEEKIFSASTAKEYTGIIREVNTGTSTIYLYENGGFGLEEGKIFVDETNTVIDIIISFDNKIISRNNIIYEINTSDNTLSTSKLGVFSKVGYRKNEGENTYKINLLSNTGSYDFESSYYLEIN